MIRDKEEKINSFHLNPLKWARESIDRDARQFSLLGRFLLFVSIQPWIATSFMPSSDHSQYFFTVHIIGTLLASGLALYSFWRRSLKHYFPFYCLLCLTYCLPFTYFLYWLYNPTSILSGLLLLISNTLLLIVTGWRIALILGSIGWASACLLYTFSGGVWAFEMQVVATVASTITLSLAFSFFFFRNQRDKKGGDMQRYRLWTNSFSHDLLNILHNVKWLSEAQKSDRVTLVRIAGQADEGIKQSIIFRDLVRYDKISPNNIKETYIQDVLKRAHSLIAGEYQSRVSVVHSEDFQVAVCQPMICAVISNLVKNAFWHGGATEVEIGWNKEQRSMYIKDNGQGISPKAIPYIFNLYYSTSSTGIGLAFVKRVLEAMKASINFSTDKKGTTFCIFFHS